MKLTQTNDISLLLNAIGTCDISRLFKILTKNLDGEADFFNAVKIAQLSLKHRQNKSQKQRIIIFVGHPLKENEADFEELGVRMKRNNVAVDVINFAHPENVPKLQQLINAANSNGNSHFLDVPLGVSMITDVLIASPIINEGMEDGDVAMGGVGAGAGAGASQFADFGGIDPNLDPELAMALRISLEEERNRQRPADVPQPGQPEPLI
jgi:26S proteasome regulatory subunit N10